MSLNLHKSLEDYLKHTVNAKNYLTIVMNGVINSDYGEEIDASECVFRFNLFVATNQYKHLVGKKTSHWIVNGCSSMAAHRKQIALCPFPAKKYDSKIRLAFKTHCAILYTGADYREYKDPDIEFPTTGYVTILMLLKLFKLPLHVYGMDGLLSGHYWNTQHYHARKHSKNLEVEHLKREYPGRIIWK